MHGVRALTEELQEVLVVEEKHQILEHQLKEELYNYRDNVRPRVYSGFDRRDNADGERSVPMTSWLLPAHRKLSPALIARAIIACLEKFELSSSVRARIASRITIIDAKEKMLAKPRVTAERKPWFYPGYPHNTSANVPRGPRTLAGIDCHYTTVWMDRCTGTFSQMGGEGVAWIGQMPFSSDQHVLANLSDGTYYHSGLLVIRASIAAKVNIIYKILYNDVAVITGDQSADGPLFMP